MDTSGRIRANGFAVQLSSGVLQHPFSDVPVSVALGVGQISGGAESQTYVYISGSFARSYASPFIDVSWESVSLLPGRTSDDLAGWGYSISFAGGRMAGWAYNQNGELIGTLGGIRTNLDFGATASYTWVISTPSTNQNGDHVLSQRIDYGTEDYIIETSTYHYQHSQGLVYTTVVDRSYHITDTEMGPVTTLMLVQTQPTTVANARAVQYLANPHCFLAGTPILMADGTEKAIEQVRAGDQVLAFDPSMNEGIGSLVPRAVLHTFQNTTKSVLDLRGLHMTPGHVCLTGEGGLATIAAILRNDGALVDQHGQHIRARTGALVASSEDACIVVAYTDPKTGATHRAVVRAGIPVGVAVTNDGQRRILTLADVLARSGLSITPDSYVHAADGSSATSVDWPSGTTPFDHAAQRNWIVLTREGEHYTPDWVATLDDSDAHRLPLTLH